MSRAHIYKVATDGAGNALAGASVRVLDAGTLGDLAQTLYTGDTGGGTLTNPFTTPNGVISIYLDDPARIHLAVTPSGGAAFTIYDLDVDLPGGLGIFSGQTISAGLGAEAESDAQLLIFSTDPANRALVLRGDAAQTEVLFLVEQEDGTDVASIDNDGNVVLAGELSADTVTATSGLQVGNSEAGTTPGTVQASIEVFDETGASLGFVAVYDEIT